MTRDISSLPLVALTRIFNSLNAHNRLAASLVCKKWLQIIDCPPMLCDIKIQFSGKIKEALNLFSCMTRRFQWFSFHRVVIKGPVVEFLMKYDEQFGTLSFIDCKIGKGKCKSKIQGRILHCHNLKTLDVQNSNVLFLFASLFNVTTLKLHMSSGLSDYDMSKLHESLCILEKLTIGANVLCGEESCKIFYDEGVLKEDPSDRFLTFGSIEVLIEKNRNTLTHVSFTCSNLSAEAVLTISKIEGLNLRSISFPINLHSEYIAQFCENQLFLASLDLSVSLHVTDDTVFAVCECLPNLQELIIRSNQEIDPCIVEIFRLRNLVKLDLSRCLNISYVTYVMAMSILETFKLKYLDMAATTIKDGQLFELLQRNPNIRFLNASDIRVSDKTLNMICQNLTLLECLILESCPTISDSGLTGEFENHSDSLSAIPLSNLKRLTELNLSQNNLITNEGCLKSIRFPELENCL
ncbi:hypothetical protein TNCT_734241 [Trichonephila clavata]|uniref:F-box domain-containing protein n=1 Tax=Trichonephila clavata TaxID=2740835 RepID=A0A8X6KHM5_TRICU|nr:hypothetical protein TNCT_734241 [Trichonephila clavata]